MASEAEYERLYQEWRRKNANGGSVTLAGANTPAEIYDETSSINLSPEQIAELQARQSHYNRTQALQTISSEIGANNFTNPYDARSTASIAALTAFGSSAGALSIAALSGAFGNDAAILAGVSAALGIDFEKVLLVAGLTGIGITMFNDLQGHTNNQVTNLPETLEQASSLAGMNAQFGEMPSSCSLFNELMGILSGAFDGVFDFIDEGLDKLMGMINQVAGIITDITAGITAAIAGGIDAIVDSISDMIPQEVKDALNAIGNLASSLMGAVADIANQVANEIANVLEMAAQIAQKLAALAMAAAMLDPCQLAVLLNVGSLDLKSAAESITQPITNIVEEIKTEFDTRVDPQEVINAVEQAKEQAETAAGVPQSPMTRAAKLYSPTSAYLHPSVGGNLQQVAPSKFGTDQEFEVQGNKVTPLPETGSASSDGVTTYTPATLESNIYAQWKSEHSNNALQIKRRVGKLRNQVRKALNTGTFRNESVRNSVEDIKFEANEISAELNKLLSDAQTNLSYYSDTGKRIPSIEQEKENAYKTIWGPRASEGISRMSRDIANLESTWTSYQSLIIM